MIELFLVVMLVNNVPKVEVFQSEQIACIEAEENASLQPRIYRETIDRRHDNATEIKEGICKPLKQFIGVK